jgi:NDP-sugar pyrophosphorylase family protein
MNYAAALFFDLRAYAHSELFKETRYAWDALARVDDYIISRCSAPWAVGESTRISPSAHFDGGPIEFGDDCVVEAGAYIRGPALFGNRVTVRHGAYVRGGVVTGNECLIGHDTEVKNAIFLDAAKAPHFAYVGDSILGNSVNLGAGTKLSNLKVIGGLVFVGAGAAKIETGLRKLGAILGDGVEVGCNSVLNPGCVVGPRSVIYPNSTVTGVIPSDTVVKLRQTIELAPLFGAKEEHIHT